MTPLDYFILIGTMIGIAAYGTWKTRHQATLKHYLRGEGTNGWFTIGISIMATQASAITFLSTPGQGFESGMAFVQNYFGVPLAMIVIAIVFLPIYRRLNVDTAYEYLGRRFDKKTRLLGAGLFLVQRGLAAGISIYAPAIVLSTIFGWRLDLTIIFAGLVVTIYTVVGGTDAVSLTQKYQMGIIFAGMAAALVILIHDLPGITLGEALTVAGGLGKTNAIDFDPDPNKRYTFWSGVLGALFLSLSYFGTDQSQVQRYLHGASLRESRLGLLFNGFLKIPMQFFILLIGVLMFVLYQFERPPVYFNQTAWKAQEASGHGPEMHAIEDKFGAAHTERNAAVREWLAAKRSGDTQTAATAEAEAKVAHARVQDVRAEARVLVTKNNPKGASAGTEPDYVFITFILTHLPHGLIGLLVAVFFASSLSSKASELNALGSTTIVDLYRPSIVRQVSDRHFVVVSKLVTAAWGLVAIGFALYFNLAENLIQAINVLGSLFYGVILGIFLVAFFLKRVGGTAVFYGAILTEILVFIFYLPTSGWVAATDPGWLVQFTAMLPKISYLWLNPIGCFLCLGISFAAQLLFRGDTHEVQD